MKKKEPEELLEEVTKYKRQAQFFKKEYNKLLNQHTDINNLVERMAEVLTSVESHSIYEPIEHDGKEDEEEAIALFSDSQVGTKSLGKEIGLTKPTVYGAMGDYNFNVFRYRLQLWLRGLLRCVEIHRKGVPVEKLNLWFLGDILENEVIFRGQGAYIETGILQQYFASLYEVGQVIAILAGNFKEIEIRGVTGNHGRMMKKQTGKFWVNWEWLWYRYLELICRDLDNVKFELTMSWYDLPKVQGHRFLMLHGEDARRYLAYPWYGLVRLIDGYYKLLSAIGEQFNNVVFGHQHVANSFQTSFGEWFGNGNWTGYTIYGIKRLYTVAMPKQWLLFCHKNRITSRVLIDLTVKDKKLWRKIKKTAYDIHIPPTNQEILAAMDKARMIQI